MLYVSLFALLAKEINEGLGEAEAIWNLILRLASATLGFVGGGFTGFSNTQFVYKWLGDKMRVLKEYNQYLDTKQYRPKTYEETVKERIEAVKKKEESDKASVIIPECLTQIPLQEDAQSGE